MFGRNQKLAGLTLAAVWVAGCAHSDFRVRSASQSGRGGVNDATMADAPLAESPSILPQTHLAAAKLFESQGMPNKAITQYRKAIAVNHSYVEAHERLGLLLSRIGRHEEASRTLRQGVALRPKDPKLRNNLGFELLLIGNAAGAEEAFQEAVRLDPGFARARVNLGIAQSRLGRFDEALESFRVVLPEPDAYYNLALMYRGEGKAAAAVEALQHVLTIDPEFAAAKQQLEQLASHVAVKTAAETLTQAGPVAASLSAVAPMSTVVAESPRTLVTEVRERGADSAGTGGPKPCIAVVTRTSERMNEPTAPPTLANAPTAGATAWQHVVETKAEALSPEPKPVTLPVAAQVAPIADSATPETDLVLLGNTVQTAEGPAWANGEPNVTLKNPWEDAGLVFAEVAAPPADRGSDAAPCPHAAEDANIAPVAKPTAQPIGGPEIAAMLGRRVEASGFQMDRPDVADQIEVLQNDFRCLAAGRVDAVAINEPAVSRPAEVVTNVVNDIEPGRGATSAWSQAIGSMSDIAPASVAEGTVASAGAVEIAPDIPCDEALMIEYVPACDPIGTMGEFSAALDPAAPIVYLEEPVEAIGFSLAVASQLPDAGVFDIQGITSPAVIDATPTGAPIEVVSTTYPAVETEPNSSVNRVGVIRYLEGQLSLVRSEIACLEEQELKPAASETVAAGNRGDVRLVAKHESVPDGDTKTDLPKGRKNDSAASAAKRPLKATGRAPIVKPQPKKVGQLAPKAREVRKRQALQNHRSPND